MSTPAKILDLRRLLAERMPSARLGIAAPAPVALLPTGLPGLDAALGGGLPAGETVEVVGEGAGSGTAQVLHALLGRCAADGRFLALVDGADSFDADAVEPAVLARLLWARCRTVDESLQAADILLRDSNFPLVVLDLKLNPPAQLRRISGSVWHRFGRLQEPHRTTLLVITSQPLVGGASVRVRCAWKPDVAAVSRPPEASFDGLRFEVLRQVSAAAAGAEPVARMG